MSVLKGRDTLNGTTLEYHIFTDVFGDRTPSLSVHRLLRLSLVGSTKTSYILHSIECEPTPTSVPPSVPSVEGLVDILNFKSSHLRPVYWFHPFTKGRLCHVGHPPSFCTPTCCPDFSHDPSGPPTSGLVSGRREYLVSFRIGP